MFTQCLLDFLLENRNEELFTKFYDDLYGQSESHRQAAVRLCKQLFLEHAELRKKEHLETGQPAKQPLCLYLPNPRLQRSIGSPPCLMARPYGVKIMKVTASKRFYAPSVA